MIPHQALARLPCRSLTKAGHADLSRRSRTKTEACRRRIQKLAETKNESGQ